MQTIREGTRPFAVVMPVQGTSIGLWRGVELLKSLFHWEPGITHCVILEDSEHPLGLGEFNVVPASCRLTSVQNPLRVAGRPWVGGLTAGILKALCELVTETSVDVILRIDADALVIGAFTQSIRRCIEAHPDAGVIGVIGGSPNADARERLRRNKPSAPQLIRALDAWPSLKISSDEASIQEEGGVQFPGGFISCRQLHAFEAIRPHIVRAMANGYSRNEDCQGGACAVTRSLVERFIASGYLEAVDQLGELPFPDDQILAMYSYAVGLRLVDFSHPGDAFGVQCSGLAYPPEQLVERGYSIIHSLKNDYRYSEESIRRYFRDRE